MSWISYLVGRFSVHHLWPDSRRSPRLGRRRYLTTFRGSRWASLISRWRILIRCGSNTATKRSNAMRRLRRSRAGAFTLGDAHQRRGARKDSCSCVRACTRTRPAHASGGGERFVLLDSGHQIWRVIANARTNRASFRDVHCKGLSAIQYQYGALNAAVQRRDSLRCRSARSSPCRPRSRSGLR